jgi:DNA-binding IclR family transcriptional regulator
MQNPVLHSLPQRWDHRSVRNDTQTTTSTSEEASTSAPGVPLGTVSAVSTRNRSSSLRRALLIVDFIAEFPGEAAGPRLAEISAGIGLNKTTILRLMAPLLEEGLLTYKPDTARYGLGPRTAYLGTVYLERLDLRDVAHDILAALVEESGETAHLVILDGFEVVYVDKVESPSQVRMYSRLGSRLPAYSTSVGKAFLAYLPDSTIRRVAENGMPRRTPHTITTEEGLRAQLARIREQGFAVDDVENELGIRCVGAAVLDHTDTPVAAISISGPDTRVTPDRVPALGRLVSEAAVDLSKRLSGRRG